MESVASRMLALEQELAELKEEMKKLQYLEEEKKKEEKKMQQVFDLSRYDFANAPSGSERTRRVAEADLEPTFLSIGSENNFFSSSSSDARKAVSNDSVSSGLVRSVAEWLERIYGLPKREYELSSKTPFDPLGIEKVDEYYEGMRRVLLYLDADYSFTIRELTNVALCLMDVQKESVRLAARALHPVAMLTLFDSDYSYGQVKEYVEAFCLAVEMCDMSLTDFDRSSTFHLFGMWNTVIDSSLVKYLPWLVKQLRSYTKLSMGAWQRQMKDLATHTIPEGIEPLMDAFSQTFGTAEENVKFHQRVKSTQEQWRRVGQIAAQGTHAASDLSTALRMISTLMTTGETPDLQELNDMFVRRWGVKDGMATLLFLLDDDKIDRPPQVEIIENKIQEQAKADYDRKETDWKEKRDVLVKFMNSFNPTPWGRINFLERMAMTHARVNDFTYFDSALKNSAELYLRLEGEDFARVQEELRAKTRDYVVTKDLARAAKKHWRTLQPETIPDLDVKLRDAQTVRDAKEKNLQVELMAIGIDPRVDTRLENIMNLAKDRNKDVKRVDVAEEALKEGYTEEQLRVFYEPLIEFMWADLKVRNIQSRRLNILLDDRKDKRRVGRWIFIIFLALGLAVVIGYFYLGKLFPAVPVSITRTPVEETLIKSGAYDTVREIAAKANAARLESGGLEACKIAAEKYLKNKAGTSYEIVEATQRCYTAAENYFEVGYSLKDVILSRVQDVVVKGRDLAFNFLAKEDYSEEVEKALETLKQPDSFVARWLGSGAQALGIKAWDVYVELLPRKMMEDFFNGNFLGFERAARTMWFLYKGASHSLYIMSLTSSWLAEKYVNHFSGRLGVAEHGPTASELALQKSMVKSAFAFSVEASQYALYLTNLRLSGWETVFSMARSAFGWYYGTESLVQAFSKLSTSPAVPTFWQEWRDKAGNKHTAAELELTPYQSLYNRAQSGDDVKDAASRAKDKKIAELEEKVNESRKELVVAGKPTRAPLALMPATPPTEDAKPKRNLNTIKPNDYVLPQTPEEAEARFERALAKWNARKTIALDK